jgi:phage shock protein A
MNLFSRLSELLEGDLDDFGDRAEDPELLSARILNEMEAIVDGARRYAAVLIAVERRLAHDLDQSRGQAERWRHKAAEALAAGRDDLVRRALARKEEQDDLARHLETEHTAARQISAQARASLEMLEARLTEARQRQRSLLARHWALAAGAPDAELAPVRFDFLEQRLSELDHRLRLEA